MTRGRSIRLFLVDGAPSGLLTAEIVNWTSHALTGRRGKLSEILEGQGWACIQKQCMHTLAYT